MRSSQVREMFPNFQASNDSVSTDKSFPWSSLVLTHPSYQARYWTTSNIPALSGQRHYLIYLSLERG